MRRTVYVELVQLRANGVLFDEAVDGELGVDDIKDARPDNLEADEEVLGIELSSFAIGLVHDVLVVHAERRWLARLRQVLQPRRIRIP